MIIRYSKKFNSEGVDQIYLIIGDNYYKMFTKQKIVFVKITILVILSLMSWRLNLSYQYHHHDCSTFIKMHSYLKLEDQQTPW